MYTYSIEKEEKRLMKEMASMKFSFKKILKAIELNALINGSK